MKPLNEMLTAKPLAKKLGVIIDTVRRWAKKGLIPYWINPANSYRYFDIKNVKAALKM